MLTLLPASIPSPDQSVWNLGPIPIRAYAVMIIIGIFVCVWITDRRWQQRGGQPGTVADVAMWAVPIGIIGARIYHVATDWQIYFGAGGSGWAGAVRIWEGGLGIWGGVFFGAIGAWIGCRRHGIPLPHFGDAVAPGLVLAQAIGRWGNWFNQELYGQPSDLPWAVQIDLANRPAAYAAYETFHPTFLYESLWNLAVFVVLIWADRRWRIGHGRLFALYVALYTLGRLWIESLRIDAANEILGLRLNVWTSILVFLGAVVYMVISARMRPGRPDFREPPRGAPADAPEPGPGAAAARGSAADAGPAPEPGSAADPVHGPVE